MTHISNLFSYQIKFICSLLEVTEMHAERVVENSPNCVLLHCYVCVFCGCYVCIACSLCCVSSRWMNPRIKQRKKLLRNTLAKGQNPLHQFPRIKSITSWQLSHLRGSYEESCVMDFGHKRFTSSFALYSVCFHIFVAFTRICYRILA